MAQDNVGPGPSFLEKLRGKRTGDIHLPTPPGGKVDPRFKKKKPQPGIDFEGIKKNFDLFKGLGAKSKEKK
jgi:hypothetical protein